MKLAVFIDSVNVEDLKKVKGYIGMIGGSCDCKQEPIFSQSKVDLEKLQNVIDKMNQKTREHLGEEKYKEMLDKMEDLKKLCKEKYSEKKRKKLEQEFNADIFKDKEKIADSILDTQPVIDAIRKSYSGLHRSKGCIAAMSNKPTWDEAPESAQILVYSPAFGWMFGSFKDATLIDMGVAMWKGEGYGSWFKPKYNRMDETVIDWRNTLEKRPAKKLSVEEAAKRIQKIIQKPKPRVKEEKALDPKLKKFYDRLKSFDPVTRSIIKEKTSKAFGLMPAKYEMVAELIKAGKMKELEDGKWQMM